MYQFPSDIRSKLPQVGTTIFSVMSKMAAEEKAINLSQGFPDFKTDPVLLELVAKHIAAGNNQYAPMPGIPQLREVIADKMNKAYSCNFNAEKEVTITSGATQAIYSAITATVQEGDEVIIFTPAYDCYEPAVELNGGKCVYVQLRAPYYEVDWGQVKKLMNRRTRMIIINTPHNPSGTIFSAEDMQKLEKITKGSDIIILSDEVYEHILFDGYEHQSVARFPGLVERSFIVYSFGKTFHNTGWKLGYCVAPENLMEEFRKIHQFVVFSSNTPIQHALAEYMQRPENYMGLEKMYEEKRNFFLDCLKGSRFILRPSAGTYFQLLDYSKITEEEDTEFAIRLTKEHKVASIPVSVFYHKPIQDKVLRFCFAKENETLERAAEILHNV